KVTNNAPNYNQGVTLLLTDGSVMCHNSSGGGYGTGWDRLIPDASGSYINGTWGSIASMNYDRLYFSSQVLPDGRVYVAGGEYGAGGIHGEVYSPFTNSWTLCDSIPAGWNIYDGNSELLYNGTVLEGPQIATYGATLIYSPSTNKYTIGPSALYGHDEASWLKLPDSSVLFVGISTALSNRYIPQTNTWVNDGVVPGNLYDSYGDESGGSFMLPNGKAIFFGANGYNAIYTPSGNSSPGTWATADSFPVINGVRTGMPDAPSAMMVNGKILCAVSPVPNGNNNVWRNPVYFVEYDYTTNTFAQVTSIFPGQGSDSLRGYTSYLLNMLDLPDGNVLVSIAQSGISNEYFIYTPGSGPIPQGKPTINNVYQISCYGYTITGKLFNGISEGASYGDDWQMETNYPIVRLTNGSNVYYAQTSYWNRIGAVQTDSLEDTAQFTLPASLPAGTYSLVVVANGFASNPVILTTAYAKLIVSAQTVNNESCIGGSNGSASALVSGGVTPYTYLWSTGATTSAISGLSMGSYKVTVTDKNGCISPADSTSITQPNPVTVRASQLTPVSCNGSNTGIASAIVSGGTLPYAYAWSNAMSAASISGLSAGTYSVTISDSCGNTATASVVITQPTTLAISIASAQYPLCYGGSGSATANPASGGTPIGIINTIAGNGTFGHTGDGGPATAAELANPPGATADAEGNIFIADQFNFEIREINYSTGVITTVAGNLSAGYNGDGIAATAAELNYPSDVAIDAAGNIFIADQNNSRIRKVDHSTGIITTVAGTGTAGYNSDGIAATAAKLYYPQSIAVDAAGNIFIADAYNNRIRKVDYSTGIISTIAGDGTPAYNGDGIPATTAEVNGPTGIVVDASGNIFISDYNNQRIRKIDHSSGYISTVAGDGIFGDNGYGILADSAELAYPTNIAVDFQGNIFIANDDDETVARVDYSSGLISNVAGDRNYGYTGDGGPATAAETGQPWDVKITPLGSIIIADLDNNAIREVKNYTYLWTPSGGTGITATGLSAGVYTITATDGNGCTASASVNITQPAPLSVLHDSIPQNGPCNGMAGVNVSGGSAPYTYLWSPGGQTTDTIDNQCAGSYCCAITDMNGCSQTTCVTVALNTTTGTNNIINPNSVTIYPEPNNGIFMISGISQGQIIDLYDCFGRKIKSYITDRVNMQMDISTVANGIYFVCIKNSDGSIVAQKKIVKIE
ncbi:MAG TPA: T9SS type A sorting domain-containing protein, partial [Bacteroidia bacterium]|nr:T9SS type A sorting domain-containing protein [Bacteroidia bacterium]